MDGFQFVCGFERRRDRSGNGRRIRGRHGPVAHVGAILVPVGVAGVVMWRASVEQTVAFGERRGQPVARQGRS